MFKKENGITLVALVITIIVLLILAGVTIASLTGDNSIITNASDAKDAYKNAENEQNDTLNDFTNQMNTYIKQVKNNS